MFVAPVRHVNARLPADRAVQSPDHDSTDDIETTTRDLADDTKNEGREAQEADESVDSADDADSPVKKSAKTGEHRSLRNHHLNVLVTMLQMLVLEEKWPQAERAYSLLLRSKGVDIRLCHDLGLQILENTDPTGTRSAEFLSRLIIAYPPIKERKGKRKYDRADVFVHILTELRIKHKQYKQALQELDSWLLIPPYKDDDALWKALIQVCEALEVEADQAGDSLEVHRLRYKRSKAVAKLDGNEMPIDGEVDV